MPRFELAQLTAVPWRNGGGQTREIASGAVDAARDWDWRLSVANIAADGAFSRFDGIDRVAVLLEGAVALDFADTTLTWGAQGEAHAFPGEAGCTARCIRLPARFFNVMTRRGQTHAVLRVHRGRFTRAADDAVASCLLVLAGACELTGMHAGPRLQAGEGVLCEGAAWHGEAVLHGTAPCLVEVRILRGAVPSAAAG